VEDGTQRSKEAHEQGDHDWIMHQVGSHRIPIVATVGKQAARMGTWRRTAIDPTRRCSIEPSRSIGRCSWPLRGRW
jgi:hypothetical protein